MPKKYDQAALLGVSADSADDAWAVGDWYDGTNQHNLTLHWNGSTWRAVAGVDPGSPYQFLDAVSADSPTDAWAVGQSLVEHWDGTSWTAVGSFPRLNALAVDALSATDAWVVGDFGHGSGASTATLHWDGTKLSRITSPNGPSHSTIFDGVVAVSSADVWTVGAKERGDALQRVRAGATPAGGEHAFTAHWAGDAWTPHSPLRGVPDLVLDAVAAGSSTQVWAAGNNDYFEPYLLRWNGSRWLKAHEPRITGYEGILAISADSTTDAWAVGSHYSSTGAPSGALIWHWDGHRWRNVS